MGFEKRENACIEFCKYKDKCSKCWRKTWIMSQPDYASESIKENRR